MSQPNMIIRSCRALFGSPNWHPAPWMSFLARSFRQKTLASGIIALCLLLGVVGTILGYQWYSDRSQPLTFNAEISGPNIRSAHFQSTKPETLRINFSVDQASLRKARSRAQEHNEYDVVVPESVLSIGKIHNTELEGASITPEIKGRWHSTESGVSFTPEKHWPADSTYRLQFEPELFNPSIKLNQETYTFTTTPLAVEVTNSRLHADPDTPSRQRYISTLTFTHPVNIDSVKQKFQLTIQDSTATVGQVALEYDLDADQQKELYDARIFHINSEDIEITSANRYLDIKLAPGIRLQHDDNYLSPPRNESMSSDLTYSTKLQIPNTENFFRVGSAQVQIVRDKDDNPQQAFLLELTDAATLESINSHLEAYVLPDKNPDYAHEQWTSASEISPDIEQKATSVNLRALPIEHESSRMMSFVFEAPENKQLLIKLKEGAKSAGGFTISKDYRAIVQIPEYPKELSFLGDGSILDKAGSHKIGFATRGIEQLHISIGKVREDQIHHLVSQSNGELKTPYFGRSIKPEDISIISEHTMIVRSEKAGKPTYSNLDLSKYLTTEDDGTGLFHIEVFGRDRNGYDRVKQQRLILITNIGFLTKINVDGTQDVFVQRVDSGEPLEAATVSVLGKNGLVVWSTTTDQLGYANIANLDGLTQDKQPVAILVEKEGDMAYLPSMSPTQQLNTSRFDTGGVYIDPHSEDDIRAYLFSDRGIYRPGETVKIGVIARAADLSPTQPFSVGLFISDPRGINVYEKQHKLNSDGFFETELETLPHSSTGRYNGTLYLVENNGYSIHLGSIQFSVEQFQPDRLKIASAIDRKILNSRSDVDLSSNHIKGWLRLDELVFNVGLDNLFGTPAQDRRVSGNYTLSPQHYRFPAFPKFVFSDVIDTDTALTQARNGALPDQTTDKSGQATFSPDLDALFAGNYALSLNTEGFEENGGRSVRTQTTVRFSPRDYLIGYKADTDLEYIKAEDDAAIELICVNRFAEATLCDNLRQQLVETTYVSTLVKQSNGTFQYQSIEKNRIIDDGPLALSESGYTYKIDTEIPGYFRLNIIDENASRRQSIGFRIVGTSNISANLEKDSHLEIVLNDSEYKAGDWIELQLNAPYTGSGLITIESTSTHAFRWFKTDTTQSVQRIQVPKGLKGNAYVQVSFIRAANSEEIFTTPLSYGISPFNVARSDHELELTLDVPSEVQPGTALTVNATADHSGKALIFAVDEGVLQVANYQTPHPLDFFLEKRALQVQTYQMFDLLLPEFELLKELSAAGGGIGMSDAEMAPLVSKNLNPYSRKVKDPVAFWSGIIDIGPDSTGVTFYIPDYFDGTLRVMAIALSEARFTQAEKPVIVKGPFVVSPNAPLVVAPGDSFSVTVGVSNQLKNSGTDAAVSVLASVSEQLEIVGNPNQALTISEGDEATITFQLKATDSLGSASLQLLAASESTSVPGKRRASTSVSVRPATLLTSTITSGRQSSGETIVPIERELMEDRSQTNMYVSNDPTLMINGLVTYLDVYPHVCTEQIVSQASPMLAYLDHPNYLGTPAEKRQRLESLFQSLRGRQLANGALTLWPGDGRAADVPTIHTLHMLIDASNEGVTYPPYLLDYGTHYLQKVAFSLDFMQREPELAAYALYLLTRLGEATNNGLIQLEEILEANAQREGASWKNQLVGAYMASSYTLLKRDEDALELVRQYRYKNSRGKINRYDSALYRDAMALYLTAKHFADEIGNDDSTRIEAIVEPILSGNINTLSSGRALLALKAYADTIAYKTMSYSAQSTNSMLNSDGTENWRAVNLTIDPGIQRHHSARLSRLNRAVQIESDSTAYYQITQTGFDQESPQKANANGLDISKSLLSADGTPLKTPPKQGDDIIVNLRIRSSTNVHHDDIAIVDLLPGGFEIDISSVRDSHGWSADYIDIREDRLVFYGAVGTHPIDVSYRARVTTAGEFIVPAAYANAMYDEDTHGQSAATTISVEPGL